MATNLELLFMDSEQFRQAVSAFAFAHSDDCPTSPTQMVDWLMAPYVDAQSKTQSKTESNLTEQSESLSDANDDSAPESDVIAGDVDANDENATCNNSGDFGIGGKMTRDRIDQETVCQSDFTNCGHPYREGSAVLDSGVIRPIRMMGAQQDVNGTCPNGNVTASNSEDSREKLESDIYNNITISITPDKGNDGVLAPYSTVLEWLDRQAEITRKTEQAAWIQQANGLIHEANVRADELRDELAKRDKGIARLKRQRDEAWRELEAAKSMKQFSEARTDASHCAFDVLKGEYDRLEAERDALRAANTALKADGDERPPRAVKKRDEVIKILKTERDALAADLRDCERQREHLRQALGCAIDHAHEVVSLVNLDGEVIG